MTRETREVLITGSTGLIGGELVATLLARNWRVHAVVRGRYGNPPAERLRRRLLKSTRAWRANHCQLAVVPGDVTDDNLGLAGGFPKRVAAILHCAGETSFNNDELCWETNCGAATRIVSLAARMATPPTIFFVSTTFVCMNPPHSLISEESSYGGYDNGYTRSKRAAEQIFLRSGLKVVIVRPSIVLSAGIEDRRMARSVLWAVPLVLKMVQIPVPGNARLDIVPVDYVASAIERLLAKTSLSHNCYNISSGEQAAVTCRSISEDIWHRGYTRKRIRFQRSDESKYFRHYYSLPTAALRYYFPFLTADVIYSNERLATELGNDFPSCPKATEYLHELLAQVDMAEAVRESARP